MAENAIAGQFSSSPGRAAAPFVGREREQVILREELAAAARGRGGVVVLGGEAGIGKTSLARDLLEDAVADGFVVAMGRCYEGGSVPDFAPWHEMLAHLAPLAGDAGQLPAPFGAGPVARTAYQLMHAVAAHLRAVAASRPLLLVLEDVHWADRDTLELLDVVTRSLASAPLLLLATYRPEAVQRTHALFDVLPALQRDRPITTLSLQPLGVDDVARLVELSHGACSAALADYLHRRSDGHPLFLSELLRDLSDRSLLPRNGDGRLLPPVQEVADPALLQHLIAHRIARLGATAETMLAVAAIVGEEWDLGVVEAVLGWEEEPLLRALEAALRADVVVPAGAGERYRFRHAMFRRVLYGEQLARRRKRVHQRIGEFLEETAAGQLGRETALAHHFAAAEVWDKAVAYGVAAGDVARERFAGHGALRAYQQALAALDDASAATIRAHQVGLYERLGQAHLLVGQPEEADAAFARMLEVARAAGDRAGEGRALVWVSYARRRQYQPGESETAGAAGGTIAPARRVACD